MRKRGKRTPYIPSKNLPVPPSGERVDKKQNTGKNRIFKRRVRIVFIICFVFVISFVVYMFFRFILPLFSITVPRPTFLHLQTIISPVSDKKNPIEELKEYLNQASIEYASLDFSSDSSSIVLTDSFDLTVIFSPRKDLKAQVLSLQAIKRNITMENSMHNGKQKKLKKIDFRFSKTIVNFE